MIKPDLNLSKVERKALIAKAVESTTNIAQTYINDWRPVDPSWSTIEGCAYLRLSTDMQVLVDQGSLEQQVHIAISEAEIKSRDHNINYRIVNFYIEPGVTGKHDKRPQFIALMEAIRLRKYRFIIVKELARVCRADTIWHPFIEDCIKSECEFVVRGIRLNPRDPIQRHMLNQLAGFASFESAINSKRQKENNHTRLIASKKFNSTHPFLGLDQLVVNGSLVVGKYMKNSEESKSALWICETFIANESEAATLKMIEEKGIKNKNGKPFNKRSLHRYLTNLKLIARAERNPKNKSKDERFLLPYERYALVEDMGYEPIISMEIWNKVQIIIQRNAEQLKKNTKLSRIYPLHPILQLNDGTTFCGTGANGNGGRKSYYFNEKHKVRIDADEADRQASRAVIQILKDSEKLLKAIKRYSQSQTRQDLLKGEVQRFKDMLAGLNCEKERASQKFETLLRYGSEDKKAQYTKEYEQAISKIDTEYSKLQARLDTLERSKSATSDDFYNQFKDNLEAAQKIQTLISKKADPVFVKAAYRKLFKLVIAEPCEQTGTYKLKFIIRGNSNSPTVTNGGHGSVMERLVGAEGLEPSILRL